ncbi:MAG: transglutaminase-like domain-containing protein, partial [Acidimicrobiales bacterium]
EVQDLVNYLAGPAFVYTLSPPPTPKGQSPLLTFLVTYRQGFCQQFAGAFGVLARELGIPVRLAVGFTTGHPVSAGSDVYEVTGADAHVWPEVYLGGQLGWVSFDPTPGPSTGEPKASAIIKTRAVKGSTLGGSKGFGDGDVGPKDHRVKPGSKIASTATTAPPLTTKVTTRHRAAASASAASGLALGGVIVAVLVVIGLFMLRRFRRSAHGGILAGHLSAEPDHVVLRSWQRASNALGRAGFTRSQWVTPIAHAEAVRTAVNAGATIGRAKTEDASASLGAATYGYMELAHLAELACYCPGKCTSRDARHAEQEAWRIERSLRSSGMLRRLPGPPPPTPTMTLVKGQR